MVVTCDIPVDVRADQYRPIVGGQRLSILSLWFLLFVAAVLIARSHASHATWLDWQCVLPAWSKHTCIVHCLLCMMYFMYGLSDPSILSGKQNYPYLCGDSSYGANEKTAILLGYLGSVNG